MKEIFISLSSTMEQVLKSALSSLEEIKIHKLETNGICTVTQLQSLLAIPNIFQTLSGPPFSFTLNEYTVLHQAAQRAQNVSTSSSDRYLPWITRAFEPTVRIWLETEAAVVLVRGHRRVGKSSTIAYVANQLNRSVTCIYVTNSRDELLREFSDKLKKDITAIYQVGVAICEAVMNGQTIIIKEIQNASDELQVSLQYGIDKITLTQKMFPGKPAGGLFLMGSLPELVDSMVESRNAALYQRVHAKLTILSFDTQELCSLFKYFKLHTAPDIMLTLKTILGGKPFLYEQAAKADLLRPEVSTEELLKEFFASELQQTSNDEVEYNRMMLGNDLGSALKAVLSKKIKSAQLAEVSALPWVKESGSDAFVITDALLRQRYDLIEPVYSMKDKSVIEYYSSADTLIDLVGMKTYWNSIKRDDVYRHCNEMGELVINAEGFQLERWIREILEDRKLLLGIPVLPGPEFGHLNDIFLLEKKISWSNKQIDIKDVEIDILGSFPGHKTLIVGSCKRSFSKHSESNLLEHWKKCLALFENGTYRGVAQRLHLTGNGFPNDWTVHFIHFSITKGDAKGGHYYFSLMDLLEPFFLN